MARIINSKRDVVLEVLGNITNEVSKINTKLGREEADSPELDATYKAGLDTSAKQDMATIVKLLRWMLQDYFNINNLPAAFTDAQIDTHDEDIRTHEDD